MADLTRLNIQGNIPKQQASKPVTIVTSSIQVSLSAAFYNKQLRDGEKDSARAYSFKARRVSVSDFILHIMTGNAWAVGTYIGDHRAKEAFTQSQVMALDLDERSMEQAFANKDVKRYAALVHQTPSHTPEMPKTRVVFILDRPVNKLESWENGQRAVIHHFADLAPDTACAEAARYYYGCQCQANEFSADSAKQLPVEVIAQWVKERETAVNAALEQTKTEAPAQVMPRHDPAGKYAESAYLGVLSDLRGSGEGERNTTLFKCAARALAMARGAWPGISEGRVLSDMEREGLALSLTKAEVEATLKSAQKTAVGTPLILQAAPPLLPAYAGNGKTPTIPAFTNAPVLSTISVDDARQRFNDAILSPTLIPGFKSNIAMLDLITGGFQRGYISAVVAETGSQKTQFCMGAGWNAMQQTPILIMSMEAHPYQIINRLVAYGARRPGVSFGDIGKGIKIKHFGARVATEPFDQDDLIAIRRAQGELRVWHEAGRFHIVDKPGMTDLGALYIAMGQWISQHKIGLIIWDGFGDIVVPGMSIFDRTTTTMLYAERIARDFNVAILGTAQGGRNTKGRGNKVLGLQDAYGGSAIEFKSAVHMTIYDPHLLAQRGDIDQADIPDNVRADEAIIRINKVREGSLLNNSIIVHKIGGAGFYERKVERQNQAEYLARIPS